MERTLKKQLLKDLYKKILIVTGPRQVGKTTLTKTLIKDIEYLNYDLIADRKKIHKSDLNFNQVNYIFDELHKMKNWKRWLKGHYDSQTVKKSIIVTGSAQLDTYKKMGDSLAGRFFQYRLFPLDVKEVCENKYCSSEKALEQLLELSGFPEPFLSQDTKEYKKWRKSHLDIILKQDLLESDSVQNIKSVELLIELMTERVGSPISYNSLREDLSTDDKTIKRWFLILENMYVFFKVTPYFNRINLAIKKSPKYYFFDLPRVLNEGARFENLIALSLLKEIYFRNDTLGEDYSLHYLRNKNQNEVDFLICNNKKPILMIEVKLSDLNLNHHFSVFEKQIPGVKKVILVKKLKKQTTLKDGTLVVHAHEWLSQMKWPL